MVILTLLLFILLIFVGAIIAFVAVAKNRRQRSGTNNYPPIAAPTEDK